MIPCANPGAQYRASKAAIRRALSRVLESGTYILGVEVASFERNFADYLGSRHAIGVGNGTDALMLALRGLRVGPGDEVITVSMTAIATVAAVIATGATPVLVDIEPAYATIDPAGVARAITRRTKAIIAVHLYGQAADLGALKAIAVSHRLPLIEDCAQAAGGAYRGRRLGTIGDMATFSFYPTKNLGALGDGGAVVTRNARLAERVRRLREYGWDGRRETRYPGVNSRLDPLQAAILNVKLARLDTDNARRARTANRYAKALAGLPVSLPRVRPDTVHAFHLFAVGCRNRDALIEHFARDGIAAGLHYAKPVHRHSGYDALVQIPKGGLPETDRLARRTLSLPLYPELTRTEAEQVICSIHRFYAAKRGRSGRSAARAS